MNLAFGDTVAPLQGEPRCDRDQVILQPTGETGQFRNPAVDRPGHPCMEYSAMLGLECRPHPQSHDRAYHNIAHRDKPDRGCTISLDTEDGTTIMA
jgi:hypothetical protein